jgi:hypothetical protein
MSVGQYANQSVQESDFSGFGVDFGGKSKAGVERHTIHTQRPLLKPTMQFNPLPGFRK